MRINLKIFYVNYGQHYLQRSLLLLQELNKSLYLDMAEIKIEVKGYKCERCGHEWIPRKKEYPILCPNCKSAYWDKPARKKK